MHRNTMAGLALASALAELESDGRVVLDVKQREAVWAAFDQSMDQALAETPAGCVVKVEPAASRKLHGNSSSGRSTLAASSGAAVTQDATVAPEHRFSLYRKIDGVTTIVLKDPTVVVSKRNGEEERVPLDYLTVRIKDVSDKAVKGRKRGRT
jgi:hypothetical protein